MRRKCILLAVLSLLLAGACNRSESRIDPRTAIIGTWRTDDGKNTTEFTSEGTLRAEGEGIKLTAKYAFIDDNTLRIDVIGLGKSAEGLERKVVISKDELVLTDDKGKEGRYRRVQQERPN